MIKRKIYIVLLVLAALILASCNPTLQLHKDDYLLNKNTVKCDDNDVDISKLEDYCQQQPNNKVFGVFAFRLRLYSVANWSRGFYYTDLIRNTAGEPPVIFDVDECDKTQQFLKMYMNNHGYFNSEVTYLIDTMQRRTNVTYFVAAQKPYTLKEINYKIDEPILKSHVDSLHAECILKVDDLYDVDIIDDERDRIATSLKNLGYYAFSREYISFIVDSNYNSHQVSITIAIKKIKYSPIDIPNAVFTRNHQKYLVQNVYFYQDIAEGIDNSELDTIFYSPHNKDYTIAYIYIGKALFRPSIVESNSLIYPNTLFNQDNLENTYKKLSRLQNFKYINIDFETYDTLKRKLAVDTITMDCHIHLSKRDGKFFEYEFEGTNTGGTLGVAGGISFQHRNIFKGAELFDIKLRGLMEVQKSFANEGDDLEFFYAFNSFEIGGDMGFTIPRLLSPFKTNPSLAQTNMRVGINFQQRPDYTRYIIHSNFGYEWQQSKRFLHQFSLLDLSSVRIEPDSTFAQTIQDLNNLAIKNTYSDHLVSCISYYLTIDNKESNKDKRFTYLRMGVQTSGNTFYAINSTLGGAQNSDGIYTIFQVPYSQFVRMDVDLRYYHHMRQQQVFVSRIATGVGIPYGNSKGLPFERSFFTGGANSNRGWRLKDLGPGSYSKPDSINDFERIGDILFEFNLEYRYPIYNYLKGALFIDVSNIWLFNENSQMENGNFLFQNFIPDLAIGAGIGLRLDIKFFVIRFDLAMPLKDPSMPEGDRWIWSPERKISAVGNIGIGYPF